MTVVIKEDPQFIPVCPHCNAELGEIVGTMPSAQGSSKFKFGKQTVFACPRCRKVLGFSQRKGFWAG